MIELNVRPAIREALVIAILGAITLAVSSWFFFSMGKFTGGSPSTPLDDSYIYFQYARNLAEGRPFHYSLTDEPSTGATSLLYTLILGAGYRLGAKGESIVIFAFILGSCFLFASSLIMARILKTLSGGVASIAAAILLLTNGHIAWAYLSGMEVGLFATTILLTLLLFLKERAKRRFFATSISAALMGFSRPEGFFLAVPVALLVLAGSRGEARAKRLSFAAISLSGGLQFLLNWFLTGSFASSGAQVKSVFYTQEPDVLHAFMVRFFAMARSIFSLFLSDFHSSSLGPNWALFVTLFLKLGFLAAFFVFLFGKRCRNSVPVLLGAWVVLSVFLSLIPWAWNVHLNRYQVPFFPIYLVISSVGFGTVAGFAQKRAHVVSQIALAILFGFVAVSFLGTTKRMALIYAHNCENIHDQQARVGKWLNLFTPSDMIVGLNDAGAIAYYGERRVFDFVGVVTTNEAINWRSGIGSVVEGLERLPEKSLPGVLAIYPNWLPFFLTSGIARTEIFRAHLDLNTICGGSDKVVYLPDWSLIKSGHPLPSIDAVKGLTLVDSLDVAYLQSEREHSYKPLGDWRSDARVLTDSAGLRIMDGGRRLLVGETMRVRCSAARELSVLMRLDAGTTSLSFYVQGRRVGSIALAKTGEGWEYASFRVPVEYLRKQPVEIFVRVTSGSRQSTYSSFYYWFLQ